jgi:hypothetical protein
MPRYKVTIDLSPADLKTLKNHLGIKGRLTNHDVHRWVQTGVEGAIHDYRSQAEQNAVEEADR